MLLSEVKWILLLWIMKYDSSEIGHSYSNGRPYQLIKLIYIILRTKCERTYIKIPVLKIDIQIPYTYIVLLFCITSCITHSYLYLQLHAYYLIKVVLFVVMNFVIPWFLLIKWLYAEVNRKNDKPTAQLQFNIHKWT